MGKRITALLLSILLIACALPAAAKSSAGAQRTALAGETVLPSEGSAQGDELGEGGKLGYGIDYLKATFNGETHDVRKEVMEIDGGMAAPIEFELEYTRYVDLTFGLSQRNGKQEKQLIKTADDHFSINADEFEVGWPVYLDVYSGDNGQRLSSDPLGLRINKGLMATRVPDTLSAEFQSGLKVDMSDLLPGMELNVLPFLIPVTVKTYTDGAVRVGIGVNSSDVDFWLKAGNGEMPEQDLGNKMKELFYGNPHNLDDISGKNMGVIFIFSGWAEGNMNDTSPITGHMEVYIGTGFDIQGQYGIFTWEITLTGGAQGIFDFSFNYSEEDSKYHFSGDEFRLGVKGGLEVYGGVGCVLASVGVYGAGSIAYQERIYPDAEAEHLVLAGELGIKAKLFGKVIACFKIISGSHDFVFDKKKKLTLSAEEEEIRTFLLENDYAHTPSVLLETEGNFTWHGEFVEQPTVSNGWEDDPNFAHLLATDIYPDSYVQIVSSGSRALPEMTLLFVGSNQERAAGNRAMLMSSYYDVGRQFVSTPTPVYDDGTADFNPYLYSNPDSWAYLVWENATAPVSADATLAEISNMTDICFGSCITSANWHIEEKVTNYAGTGTYATGARVTADKNNVPAIAYYTNSVNDPAGLSGTHEVFLATCDASEKWVSKKICEVNGAMGEVNVAYFDTQPAVSVSWEENGVKKTALYQYDKQIWAKDNASSGKFVGSGYSTMYFTWYENGRIRKLSVNFEETDFTPNTITIPSDAYEIFGRAGSSTVMVAGTSVKDAEGAAFAYVSRDGGLNWARADLSTLNEFAYVSHIGAAYTYENDPVIVYSVQNYKANVDLQGTQESEGTKFLLGEDDNRFTDTRADLYISARRANLHVSFVEAVAIEPEKNKPGNPARVMLRIRNTGLYDVEKASIVYGNTVIGFLDHTLKPWETADIEVEVPIPMNVGTTVQEYAFEVSTKDDLTPDSRIKLALDPGYLTATIWHSFEHGREAVSFRINNCGYTDKTARIVVRDEMQDITLQDRTVKVDGGWHLDSEFKAENNVFSLDGYKNVTLFVLLSGEEPDSPEISTNRVRSITPLSELYAQKGMVENETSAAPDQETEAPTEPSSEEEGRKGYGFREWLPLLAIAAVISIAIVAGIAIAAHFARKKREEAEAQENETGEEKDPDPGEKPEE